MSEAKVMGETKGRRCRACGGEMETRNENYNYDASGLDNVTLEGIEVRHCPKCGSRQPLIPALAELHRVIAFSLAKKKDRLLPREIRFLRKYLGLSSGDFADKIGVDASTVSRYERLDDPQQMGRQTERLLRLMVFFEKPVDKYPLEEWATEEPKPERLTMVSRKGNWYRESETRPE